MQLRPVTSGTEDALEVIGRVSDTVVVVAVSAVVEGADEPPVVAGILAVGAPAAADESVASVIRRKL